MLKFFNMKTFFRSIILLSFILLYFYNFTYADSSVKLSTLYNIGFEVEFDPDFETVSIQTKEIKLLLKVNSNLATINDKAVTLENAFIPTYTDDGNDILISKNLIEKVFDYKFKDSISNSSTILKSSNEISINEQPTKAVQIKATKLLIATSNKDLQEFIVKLNNTFSNIGFKSNWIIASPIKLINSYNSSDFSLLIILLKLDQNIVFIPKYSLNQKSQNLATKFTKLSKFNSKIGYILPYELSIKPIILFSINSTNENTFKNLVNNIEVLLNEEY